MPPLKTQYRSLDMLTLEPLTYLCLETQIVLLKIFIVVIISLLIDYHRCQKALDAKGVDTAPCDWYKRVYKSLCPISWVNLLFFF